MKVLRISALAAIALHPQIAAIEYSPRVLSPHTADTYSLRTFAQFPRWRDLEGDLKVLAIFEYLADRRTGIYPMGAGPWEGEDVLYEYGYCRDPVKMLNVHPVGYCDMFGPVAAAILEGVSVGRARTVGLPGLPHVFAEVEIAGRWAYVDLDLRAVFVRPDGTLASTEDARRDPFLWERPRGPKFFPLDDPLELREAYRKSPVEYRYGVAETGHTMDYVLRRGESFARWWKPQGDRWLHHRSYHENLRDILEREPKGPKSKHGDAYTIHTRGNGRFEYRPDLTDASEDFADGVHDCSNVRTSPEGLTLEAPGRGWAVFEFRSPYAIVPRVGRYETAEDDREAAAVEADGDGVALETSPDGATWTRLVARQQRIDLTPWVSGKYCYYLRAVLEGSPGEAVLRRFAVTTWVQVHPASLPSLRRGPNQMRYVTGDHYGLPTRVLEIRSNGSRREDFLRHVVEQPPDYDPDRKTERARGPFVVRVDALPGTRIAWFSAGASFATYQGPEAARTRNSIAYAVGEPKGFRELYRSQVPQDQAHWHMNADVEVRLEEPAKTLFLKYVGDPAVNNYRVYAHCLEDRSRPRGRVVIEHEWKEQGETKVREVVLSGPGAYEILCEEEPEDVRVEISVPGGPRT